MKVKGLIDIDLKELPMTIADDCDDEEVYQLIKSLIIQTNRYDFIKRLVDDHKNW